MSAGLPVGAALFGAYVMTVVGANWATSLWPAVAVAGLQIPAGTFFAGVGFTVRDLLQDIVGARSTVLAVTIGAAMSGLIASPRIALASATAFVASELVDLAIYTVLRGRSRVVTVGLSNVFGLLVDSLLFLLLAFGSLGHLAGTLAGKASTTVAAVVLLALCPASRRAST